MSLPRDREGRWLYDVRGESTESLDTFHTAEQEFLEFRCDVCVEIISGNALYDGLLIFDDRDAFDSRWYVFCRQCQTSTPQQYNRIVHCVKAGKSRMLSDFKDYLHFSNMVASGQLSSRLEIDEYYINELIDKVVVKRRNLL